MLLFSTYVYLKKNHFRYLQHWDLDEKWIALDFMEIRLRYKRNGRPENLIIKMHGLSVFYTVFLNEIELCDNYILCYNFLSKQLTYS